MNRRKWTAEEDKYIIDNYGKITFSEMAKYLNCAISTIQNRMVELGLDYDKRTLKRWTEEELELLKLMAPKYLNKTIARKLNRSVNEVNKKARELNIELIFKRPIWKKWKVKFLKENINKLSLSKIQKELDVHYYQIIDKLVELNIEYKFDFWSEEEENILIELSSKVYVREIAKVLNRTEGAIMAKANKMGLEIITLKPKFTDDDLKYIKDNWGIIPVTDMARNLGYTRTMIQTQADKMNLPKLGNNPYNRWTDEKLKELEKLASIKTITQLAKHFKTTNDAIITVGYRNGIFFNDDKVKWTEEENEMLRNLAKSYDLSELAEKMNKSTSSIRLQAQRKNIKIIPNKNSVKSTWYDEDNVKLQNLAAEGKTLLEISNLMNKTDTLILRKAKELGLEIKRNGDRKWTDEEIEKLRELAKTKKISELVKELNRTSSSIKAYCQSKGIKIINERKKWTEEEYKLLEKLTMIDKKTPKEIAEILDRTEDAVILKINRRGLQIQTNDKRFWKKDEEVLLEDLWGNESIEIIAKKLNRTPSSIKNKAFQLGLGSTIENNYNGLTIKEISELFNIDFNIVSVSWIALGLKYKVQKISKSKSYRYVEISDLYEFLEKNQNIWDSRKLEKNVLGIEPEWLKEKRKLDKQSDSEIERLNMIKQQLILSEKYYLNIEEVSKNMEDNDENAIVKKKKIGKG